MWVFLYVPKKSFLVIQIAFLAACFSFFVLKTLNFIFILNSSTLFCSYPVFTRFFMGLKRIIYINYLQKASSSWRSWCIRQALSTSSMSRTSMSVLKREKEKTRREWTKKFSNICYQLFKMCSKSIVLEVFKLSPLRVSERKICKKIVVERADFPTNCFSKAKISGISLLRTTRKKGEREIWSTRSSLSHKFTR